MDLYLQEDKDKEEEEEEEEGKGERRKERGGGKRPLKNKLITWLTSQEVVLPHPGTQDRAGERGDRDRDRDRDFRTSSAVGTDPIQK